MMNELEIIALLKDETTKAKAFDSIVRSYQEQIYWHIRKMVLTHDDSNDVMQNTFIKAWNAIDNFRADSKISTWLYRIAVNETLTFLSRQHQDRFSTSTADEMHLQRMQADTYFDGDELQLKLQKAILTLPDKQRLVFNMKYFDEMKYEEMSSILDTSVGALKASYHHAVKKIEAFFED